MNVRILAGRICCTTFGFAVCFVALLTSALSADEFTLKDGRKVSGTLVKKTNDTLVVELSPGNMILLGQAEIKVHPQNPKGEAAYLEALKGSSDTIESHLQMAGLARKHQMLDHERAHYERVIELDTNHDTARAALGYVSKDGQWISREAEMIEGRGKVPDGKRFRFPELLAMERAEEKFTQERAQLAKEISRAIGNLSNPRNSAKAQATLDGLNGPVASAAIAFVLYPRPNAFNKKTSQPAIKALFIPILERLGDPTAIQTLINMCLDTDSGGEQEIVRQQALEVVKKLAPDAAFHAFIAALGSTKNATVNLAGQLLQELGDERAILPLIERLITFDRRVTGGGNATNAGISNGGASFSKGDPQRVENVAIENQRVLGALISLTNQNFGYKKPEWLSWYEQNYIAFDGDLRRDP